MAGIGISNGVLNQKQSPALYQDLFANRPAAGFLGRLFVATDTSQIFADNGSSWILIANTGIGSTGNLQVVTTNGNTTNTGITVTAGGLATNAAQITGLSQSGGILFTDGSGNLQQDVNLNWDATNNYMGIGQTGIPTAPLDIHNASLGVQIQLNATSTNNSTIAFQNASVGKWRVGNLYSAGANLFHIYNNAAAGNAMTINSSNAATFTGTITGSSIIKSDGTSSQFLKADGSVDSNSYITLTSLSATTPLSYNNSTGAFTILQSGASQSGYLSSTDWNTFNNKAGLGSFSATSPLSYNSGTGAFSIQVANSGQSGYLTSTDWNTFNNKQSALTLGNLTEAVSNVLSISGGTGAVIGTGTTIQIQQSSASQSGYLSSTDWTNFNNKQSQINGTGFVKASGTTISYDNSTYYLASNPNGYITLASLSGITPITYNSGTGAISIAQSGTSSSGYLSSTDWNTFNSKASLTAFSASPPLSYNSGTGAFSISQASGSTNGYLSSTDWTTFNNKQSALVNPVTGTGTTNTLPKFTSITGISNSNITDTGSLITLGSNSYIQGALGIGTSSVPTLTGTSIRVSRQISGLYISSGGSYGAGIVSDGQIQSDEVGGASYFRSQASTAAASFTSALLVHYDATQGTIGSGSTVSSQVGFYAQATLTGATSNFGFYGNIPAGANRWNLYMNGTANNYLAGNVGIGTTSPNYTTQVHASTGSSYFQITNGTTGSASTDGLIIGYYTGETLLRIRQQENDALTLDTNNTERMRITSSGNVGIGTSSPTTYSLTGRHLELNDAGGGYAFYHNTTTSVKAFWAANESSGLSALFTFSNHNLTLGTNNTERMRITSGGNVLIGTTTDNGQGTLQVNGQVTMSSISASGTTYAASATVGAFYYHVINGGSGVNLTLLSPSNNNRQYVFINTTANSVTITAATGTNIINLTSSSVSSITLLANQRAYLIADGNNKYYQIF